MSKTDADLERLLRAAAAADEPARAEAPFGFDTRVVALWKSRNRPAAESSRLFGRMLQRVAVGASIVIVSATAAAWWQLDQQTNDVISNAYAIADTAIESGALQ